MRSISLIFKQSAKTVLLLACFTVWGISAKAQGDAAKGEATFKAAGCTSCHKIDTRMTGPALGPAIASETDDKWLASWIHNSQALVAAKDPKAVDIYNKFSQTPMPAFPSLSDGDIADILAYVRADWKKIQDDKAKAAPAGDTRLTTDTIDSLASLMAAGHVRICLGQGRPSLSKKTFPPYGL